MAILLLRILKRVKKNTLSSQLLAASLLLMALLVTTHASAQWSAYIQLQDFKREKVQFNAIALPDSNTEKHLQKSTPYFSYIVGVGFLSKSNIEYRIGVGYASMQRTREEDGINKAQGNIASHNRFSSSQDYFQIQFLMAKPFSLNQLTFYPQTGIVLSIDGTLKVSEETQYADAANQPLSKLTTTFKEKGTKGISVPLLLGCSYNVWKNISIGVNAGARIGYWWRNTTSSYTYDMEQYNPVMKSHKEQVVKYKWSL